jgi:hypothetical protein
MGIRYVLPDEDDSASLNMKGNYGLATGYNTGTPILILE